ncbi:MAG: TetR/AcrR family transcriptional regulator C-terminal domain-containing protein [Lachnospiraceae bacterium]|jgi:probable dihydroxyacetone kinase regulator|nr:TetR/AcrR family transcriptional regulator C-terminal domain-containing protein [Lachnospiraceae bacterium]
MDSKKDLTKELLADCFHELLLTMPFDKITIKTITDRAGLIRATFYKHFQDKYEVLEWIFQTDISDGTRTLIQNGRAYDAVVLLVKGLEKDKDFYRKALTIDGPNSFLEILKKDVYASFLKIAGLYSVKIKETIPILTDARIASFYTNGLVSTIYDWLKSGCYCSADDLCRAYQYLMMHSAVDLIS